MYIFPDMIDMGLPPGVQWPSLNHRCAAQTILIGNPDINNMDDLQNGVINIINIPHETLVNLTLQDLNKYGFQVSTRITLK